MAGMTIARLAKAGGVGVETVRYYQRRGLLQTPARAGGIRRYGPDDVRRLRFIREAQAAGFTLAEIAELVELDASENRERARDLAEERIRELDTRIATLQTARDALSRLAEECRSGKRGPCPILSSFGL
jgi:MerR family transcriptional regulator, mercuric resistance operon regulatory protein